MRLHQRSISKVNLFDILRRRRKTLKEFLIETGIVTYETLVLRCASMGVVPPDESQFNEATGKSSDAEFLASSPTEGVVVLDPPPVVEESTGKLQDIVEAETPGIEVEVITTADAGKKKKGK